MIQEALPDLSSKNGEVKKPNCKYSPETDSAEDSKKSSTLIEFPDRRGIPEWRKQLSQRVREVQERKAREAAEELAAAQEAGLVSCALPSGQLELVPDLENSVTNPIVTKALERLERARKPNCSSSYSTPATVAPVIDEPVTEAIDAAFENRPRLTVVAPPQPVIDLVETAAEVAVAFDTAVELPVIMESPAMINESTATFEDFAATIEESIATIQES